MHDSPISRRRLLGSAIGAVASATLAGCSSGSDETNSDDGSGTTEPTETPTPEETDESSDASGNPAALDLREANVVGVSVEQQEEFRFEVTLHHDDDGEEGYANWWQVETVDGTQLGRRDLAHAHSRQPFTRSTTLEVPEDVTCVVVRGHDQTHGYGGQAMLVALESGATRTVGQGVEPVSFERSDCP